MKYANINRKLNFAVNDISKQWRIILLFPRNFKNFKMYFIKYLYYKYVFCSKENDSNVKFNRYQYN